jgi:4a-hydroxytetrahydrobiopterin dehydratase
MSSEKGPSRRRIAPEEADERLRALPGWTRCGEAITKTYALRGWSDAVGFVARLGAIAASWDHHPDVDIRWNKVKVTYTTHDAGGLTEMDFAAAASIDGLGEPI